MITFIYRDSLKRVFTIYLSNTFLGGSFEGKGQLSGVRLTLRYSCVFVEK